jgi:RNA polymerase sigma-70 factor, ECF subfamily
MREKEIGMDEDIWVKDALRGDQTAFARLVDQYKGPVYNLTYRMLGNAQDAEDAAQETFLRAYSQLRSYDPERKFSSWLLSIAAHHCIDQLRRRRFAWLSIDSLEGLDWLWADSVQPEQTVMDGEDRDEVRRLLHLLPAKYRLVLVLRYWYDMSYVEIGQTTHMSEAAVKTRLHRAREMLSEHLAARGTLLPAGADAEGSTAISADACQSFRRQSLAFHS